VRGPHLHVFSRRAEALGLAVLAVLGTGLGVAIPASSPARAAPAAAALTLESQSPAFVARQSGVNLGIDVSSALPASRLSLEVTLYSAVVARYTLRQTLQGSLPSLLTPLGNPGIIPLDLKKLAWAPGQEVMLHLPVWAPDLPGDLGTGTGGVTLSIFNCTACGGVYPLQVSLLEDGVGPVASFTTYLIVAPPREVSGTRPLQFAWVMPFGSSPAISPAGVPVPDPSDVAELQALGVALQAAPNASVSLDLFPQFVESLEDSSNATARSALFGLRALTAPGGQAVILPASFVPVDADDLVASGLSSALSAQLERARQVLQVNNFAFAANEYAANGPIDQTSLGLLGQPGIGITRLVLPSTAVAPLTGPFSQWTPTAPFLVPGSAVEAVASDPGLETDLASTASPALKAEQMLADLSVQYFDNPGTEQVMAVESPLGAYMNPVFLRTMLAGLSESSIVHAVTLSEAFDAVSPGSSATSPTKRALALGGAPTALVPAAAIATAQVDLAALGSVQPSSLQPHGKVPLSDLVLMAEGSEDSPAERLACLQTIDAQANALSGLVTLPLGRTITVTSVRAAVPISIVSHASAPFLAEFSVESPELGFQDGHSWLVKISPLTNIFTVHLTARTSGDFPLRLTLATRTGFVIQSGYMTIRSTAISAVAVALSIGAAAFLVIWWMRSILTKRRKKHKLRGAALAAGAMPASAPGA